jgi:hypothetical protein
LSRRIQVIAFSTIVALAVVTPALAKTHVVAQATSKKGSGAVFLSSSFSSNHTYRIEVLSPKHLAFSGLGTEYYVYIYKKQLGTGTKNFKLSGTTPRSLIISSPVSFSIDSWKVEAQVSDVKRLPITVRFVDLGAHK